MEQPIYRDIVDVEFDHQKQEDSVVARPVLTCQTSNDAGQCGLQQLLMNVQQLQAEREQIDQLMQLQQQRQQQQHHQLGPRPVHTGPRHESFVCAVSLSCCVIWVCFAYFIGSVIGFIAYFVAGRFDFRLIVILL